MKMKYIIILVVLITFLSCKENYKKELEKNSKITVVVAKSLEKEFTPVLSFSGTAYANKEANLGTAIPGRVEKIHYDEGQKVEKNDLLVELSSELYMQAIIERNTLKKDFERVSRLYEKGSLSEQDYDHVKAKYDASVANTEMMRKNAEIRAPFSGVIVDHIVNEGENFFFAPSLKPGYSMTSGIIKLMQLNILNIEIDINEKDISKIHKGQKATVVFDAYPHKTYEGEIVAIDPILSTLSRTVKAKISIRNNDLIIKPGMYAKVNIELPKIKAVFVPNESIYRQPGTGNDFVYIIKEDIARRIPIKRIYTVEELVAIKGLDPNESIVVAGKNKLSDGMSVVIMEK
ncbi:efflux RND transporter periplasmic adaptor subunit [Bacteroidota bacterium]